ncbi:inositol monophosphatase family protein [Halococcus sediminicola]|uniref:inositol monophosphatase family protein n=1 Tax=Halococcus sediminicola TaxID=1264579 RepID=UPI000678F1A2|nr:inositol monophosphatase [Halococcus sediminicola]
MTETRAECATRAADVGASVALEAFRGDLSVETKSDKTDLVTATDRAAQRRTVDCIREGFPDDAIVGEESDARKTVPEDGPAWIIDPIDGTSNFVRGLRVWGTSVAAVADGEPVAAATVFPALGDTYLADGEETTLNGNPVRVSAREDPETFAVAPILLGGDFGTTVGALAECFGDIRRFGCAQATLAAVAGGSFDAAVATTRMSPWDTVAGAHMIRRAGGRVTDLAGQPWRHDSDGLVASNGHAHEELLDTLRSAAEK